MSDPGVETTWRPARFVGGVGLLFCGLAVAVPGIAETVASYLVQTGTEPRLARTFANGLTALAFPAAFVVLLVPLEPSTRVQRVAALGLGLAGLGTALAAGDGSLAAPDQFGVAAAALLAYAAGVLVTAGAFLSGAAAGPAVDPSRGPPPANDTTAFSRDGGGTDAGDDD